MPERRPLVVIDGQIQELPVGDTTPGSGGGGATTFTGLTDTPATYGTVGQMLVVNATTNGLEWVDVPSGGGGSTTLLGLTDTPGAFGTAGQLLATNSTTDGTEWVDPPSGGGGGDTLPSVTPAENNRVLSVFNGAWAVRDLFAQPNNISTFDNVLTNGTPVFGGGMILRNSNYVGPAIRVEDSANPGTQTDISFDGSGRVRGTRPYGANTVLITVYDQWGNDNFTAPLATNILLLEEDDAGGIFTWQIDFGSTAGVVQSLQSTLTADTAAWATEYPVVLSSFQRVDNNGLDVIYGVRSTSNFMRLGLWQEGNDLHNRVNGGGSADWPQTNWNNNSAAAQAMCTTLQDVSVRNGNANFYFNNAYVGFNGVGGGAGINFTDAAERFHLGDWTGIGDPFFGRMIEIHVFSTTAALSNEEINFLNTAGEDWFLDENGTTGDPRLIQIQTDIENLKMNQTNISGTAYTTVDSDFVGGVVKTLGNTTPITVTVGSHGANLQPCTFIQEDVGQVIFTPDAGVTIKSAQSHLSISHQYGSATLIPDQNNANHYFLVGALA